MLILWVILGAVMLLGTVVMGRELMRSKRPWFVGESSSPLADVAEQRRLVLRELADLDAAHAAGKLASEQHEQRRTVILAKARELTQLHDQLAAQAREQRAAIERELAKTE